MNWLGFESLIASDEANISGHWRGLKCTVAQLICEMVWTLTRGLQKWMPGRVILTTATFRVGIGLMSPLSSTCVWICSTLLAAMNNTENNFFEWLSSKWTEGHQKLNKLSLDLCTVCFTTYATCEIWYGHWWAITHIEPTHNSVLAKKIAN